MSRAPLPLTARVKRRIDEMEKKETGERPGRKTRWGCSVPGLTRLASGPSATCLPRAICAEAAPDARARVSPSHDHTGS